MTAPATAVRMSRTWLSSRVARSRGPPHGARGCEPDHPRPILPLPVVYWDERLSTMAVTRTLLDADASRARRAELVDKMAAAYILQGALDRYQRMLPEEDELED